MIGEIEAYLAEEKPGITRWYARKQLSLIMDKRQEWICGARVLDVGCGKAVLEQAFAPLADAFFSCDIHFYADSDINVNFGSVESLPYADEQFDTLFLLGVIEHVANPGLALAECARVLRWNGLLILSIPNGLLWRLIGLCPALMKPNWVEHTWFDEYRLRHLLPEPLSIEKRYTLVPGVFSLYEIRKLR